MAIITDRRGSETWVWDVNTLDWVRGKQPVLNTDTVTVSMAGVSTESTVSSIKTNTDRVALIPLSGVASSSGNNLIVTPSASKKLRIYYLSYNPALPVEAAYRFGTTGQLFLRNNLTTAGSIISKDFGDFRYVQGAVDEPLYLNLSLAVSIIWNVFYVEVT